MVHLMKHHLNVNMSLNEVVLLRMLSLMVKHLIEIEHYKSQNMNTLEDQVHKVITSYQWTLRDKVLVKMDVIA